MANKNKKKKNNNKKNESAVKQLNPKTQKAIKNGSVKNAAESETRVRKPLGFMPYLLGTIAVLLFLLLIMQDNAGYLGSVLAPFFKGLFGYGAFAIPVYLLAVALLWKRDRKNGTSGARYLLCIANFIFVLVLIHMHTATPEQRSFDQGEISFFKAFYENGTQGIGGGAIGGTLGSGIEFLLKPVLTYIIGYFVAIITFLFLIGTSPSAIARAIKKSASQAAEARREREAELEEQARLAEEEARKRKPAEAAPARNTEKKRKFELPEIPDIDENEQTPPEEMIPATPIVVPTEETVVEPAVDPLDQGNYESFFKEADGDAPLIDNPSEFVDPAVSSAEFNSDAVTVKETTPVSEDGEALVPEEYPEDATLEEDAPPPVPPYVFPPISLLSEGSSDYLRQDPNRTQLIGQKLVSILRTYGVKVTLVSTSCGPAVTRYEVLPDEGVRVSRIESLADDIRLRLAASSVRIESNIPGKAAIGIEIPNDTSSVVKLRDLIDNDIFRSNKSKLFVCLGVDVGGNPIYFDIPDMPHLIIAGATGMGKSVCINSIIISLLYRAKPDELKFIMIDPKKIELSCYNGIPHLMVPVVNDPRTAAGSLNWAVNEMERRYSLMESLGTARNLDEYNSIVEGDPEREKLPYVVIIIDELADLMMTAKDAVETSICRLAQKARAAGIYLILGTQRPDATVITGLIKANVPSKIAFTVSSAIDSRIILDESGAEALLGKGDMLFAPVKSMKKIRVQGAFVDGKTEVNAVCNFVRNTAQATYSDDVMKMIEQEASQCGKQAKHTAAPVSGGDEQEDPLFLDALGIAFEYETMATSLLQRKLSVGYSRAQKMIDMMEDRGYVGKFDPATKKRKIILTKEEYDELRLNKSSAQSE
ncbi:MAG: DNA translocase FtsK [Clostridia bacterium]|nr:DNA translocase FtsK [Clostridia bacterium]